MSAVTPFCARRRSTIRSTEPKAQKHHWSGSTAEYIVAAQQSGTINEDAVKAGVFQVRESE